MGAVVVVRRELARLMVAVEWCCFVEAAGLGLVRGWVLQVEEQQVQKLKP